MHAQEKMIKQIIKAELSKFGFEADPELVRELNYYLIHDARGSATIIEAAIVRHLDQYYGVSEKTLQAGRSIYLTVYEDDDA